MKNSAWYHKLWRKKLDNLPLKEDAASSWAEMSDVLDKHMPLNSPPANNKPGKFFGSTVVSMLSFILPAAAMIGAITYVAIKHPFKNKENNKHHYNHVSKRSKDKGGNLDKPIDTLRSDSATGIGKQNLTAVSGNQKNAITRSTAQPVTNAALVNAYVMSNSSHGQYNNTISHKPVRPVVKVPASSLNTQPSNTTHNVSLLAVSAGDKTYPDSIKQDKNIMTDKIIEIKPGNDAFNVQDKLTNSPVAGNGKTGGKNKSPVINKIKRPKLSIGGSSFGYRIGSALNISKSGSNMVFGLGVYYSLNAKWLLNAGIHMDLNRPFSSEFTHPSYNRGDTTFKVNDSRKLNILSVPVTLEYKISNIISVNAGPQISFSVKQSNLKTGLGTIQSYKDTLYHTKTIDSALKLNSINKINVGFTGGVSFKLHQFYIDATYQQNVTPYSVTTGLGGYKQYYNSFQIGIRYKFKKKGP
jgi:hypothetical protein